MPSQIVKHAPCIDCIYAGQQIWSLREPLKCVPSFWLISLRTFQRKGLVIDQFDLSHPGHQTNQRSQKIHQPHPPNACVDVHGENCYFFYLLCNYQKVFWYTIGCGLAKSPSPLSSSPSSTSTAPTATSSSTSLGPLRSFVDTG